MLKDWILVANSEQKVQKLFGNLFNQVGYGVYHAFSAKSAEGAIEERYCHLIFIDLDLPDSSGIELCRRIRKINDISTIVAITGYEPVEDIRTLKDAGFSCAVKKPFRLEKLLHLAQTIF